MKPDSISEKATRYSIIDPLLTKVGWNLADHTQVGFEIPVQNYDKTRVTGFTDYCLYRPNGEVLAVVEAKKTSRDPRVGKQQVLEYVTEIEKKQSFRPFAFMSNGDDTFFWDSENTSERHVAGFFSRKNLERLLHLKQNRKPLSTIQIKESIVNRSYQVEAIRRIATAIDVKKKRKALLVMATGTGKTRTIMALIDVLLRANAAQKILFLADRDSLVNQALTDGFKPHLPNESRTRIRTYDISTGWKIGYCAAPENLTKEFRKLHQFVVFAVNTPIQYAYSEYLKNPDNYLLVSSFYQQKRDYFRDRIKNSKFRIMKTEGTYFQLLDYAAISKMNDIEFSEYLTKEIGVAVIPLSPFYSSQYQGKIIRICFAKRDEILDKAAEKLMKV